MTYPMRMNGKLPPPIMCAACGKEVDDVRVFWDQLRRVEITEVRCHGEKDTCEIPEMHAVGVGDTLEITEAVAFKTERIT